MQFKCSTCCKQSHLWKDLNNVCVTKCGHIHHATCLTTGIGPQSKAIDCPISTCNQKIRKNTIILIDLTDVQQFNVETNEPIGCILCNDPLIDTHNVSLTKCGHAYHSVCLTTFVRPKSNPCLVPSCKKKITISSVTSLQGLSDVTGPNAVVPAVDNDDGPFRLKNESKSTNSPIPIKKVSFAETTVVAQIHAKSTNTCEVKPECSKAFVHSPILKNKQTQGGQKNGILSQKTNLDVKRERLSNGLDGTREHKNEDDIQNKDIIIMLKEKCKALEEQIDTLQREQNDANKDKAVWEMCFKYLQDNAEGTEVMIPNEKTLDIMRENEKLKMKTQELERERDNAKKETKVWEMSFTFLQDSFQGTDMMIPDEKTLDILKDNQTLKICIEDLESKLDATRNDVKSAKALRTDLENYIEENLHLKNENEEMKRDLKSLKGDMTKLDTTITELVIRHSQENETVNELNDSFLNENTELNKLNENLQQDNNKLKELNETLKNDNSKLIEINKTIVEDKIKLNQQNESLQKSYNELMKFNDTLLAENKTLSVLNVGLQKENNKLTEDEENYNELTIANDVLLKKSAKLNELNESLLKETKIWKDLAISLQKQNKLNESNTQQKNDELGEHIIKIEPPESTSSKESNDLDKQLRELKTSMQEDNNKLNENISEQNNIKLEEQEHNYCSITENVTLNESNETQHKNNRLNEVEVVELKDEKKKNKERKLSLQKEKMDRQWNLINRRSFCINSQPETRKRRASDLSAGTSTQIIDLVNVGIRHKSIANKGVFNKEVVVIDLVNEKNPNISILLENVKRKAPVIDLVNIDVNEKNACIMEDVMKKEISIVSLVNEDIVKETIVKDVIKDDVRMEKTSSDVEFVKEEITKKDVKEPIIEAENDDPETKRIKLQLGIDKEDTTSNTSISSSMKINEAIDEIDSML